MGTISEQLGTEHQRLRRLLTVFCRQINGLADGGSPDLQLMMDLVDYLENYADPQHHHAENRVIAVLEDVAPADAARGLPLVRDHRILAERGQAVRRALEDLAAGSMHSRRSLVQLAQDYLRDYNRHLDRERELLIDRLPALEHHYGRQLAAGLADAAPMDAATAARYETLDRLIERLTAEVSVDDRGAVRCPACDAG